MNNRVDYAVRQALANLETAQARVNYLRRTSHGDPMYDMLNKEIHDGLAKMWSKYNKAVGGRSASARMNQRRHKRKASRYGAKGKRKTGKWHVYGQLQSRALGGRRMK